MVRSIGSRRRIGAKGEFGGIGEALLNVGLVESAGGSGDVQFVVEVDGADARIVGVDGGENAVGEECAERMRGVVLYGAGRHVACGAAFEADGVSGEEVVEDGIFDGADTMADAGGPKQIDGIADTLRAGGFPGVDGDLESGFSDAFEMFNKEGRRESGFVPRQIDRDEAVAKGEQGFELAETHGGAERPAEDAGKCGGDSELANAGVHSIGDGFDNGGRIETMSARHEHRAEAELDMVETFAGGALDFSNATRRQSSGVARTAMAD